MRFAECPLVVSALIATYSKLDPHLCILYLYPIDLFGMFHVNALLATTRSTIQYLLHRFHRCMLFIINILIADLFLMGIQYKSRLSS